MEEEEDSGKKGKRSKPREILMNGEQARSAVEAARAEA